MRLILTDRAGVVLGMVTLTKAELEAACDSPVVAQNLMTELNPTTEEN